MPSVSRPAPSPKRHLLVLLILAAPFYLNDLASIYLTDWRTWLAIDYLAVKLLPLAVVAALIHYGHMPPAAFGFTRVRPAIFFGAFVAAAFIATLIDQNAYALLAAAPGYAALGAMPAIDSALWLWVDLTVGLLLVGVLEELVFRGYLRTVIELYTDNRAVMVALSALSFGLIHWSLGLHAVLVTGIIGGVFMAIYLATRALPAIMLAHFAVNFVDFADVIPKSLFRFG